MREEECKRTGKELESWEENVSCVWEEEVEKETVRES